MANVIKMVIQMRRATAAEWLIHKDVVPAEGEPCFVTDKNILKIGDGVTTFEKLEAIGGSEDVKISADGKSIVLEDGVFKLAGFDAATVGAQPRKGENGSIEWYIPTVDVEELQASVIKIQEIVMPADDGSITLLDRVESLEQEMETLVTGLTDDGKVNTLMELIEYVNEHGSEVANMASEIKTLQDLVGDDSVANQIVAAIDDSERKTDAIFEHVKYEISSKPDGTLVDYGDKEIRVMVPADYQWTKQTVGSTGNENMFYMGFKAYAPEGAVSFKEGDRGVIVDEMFDFNGDFAGTDEFGRNYSICWLALASYDSASDTWTYFGKNSTVNKYIGWTYCVEWYDANGVIIESDSIRINLSNEACHNTIEPYYMANVVKEVSVNGEMMDVVNGKVDITVDDVVKSSDEITINEDGSLSIKSISVDKLVQDEETIFIMDGGSAV